ncbi:bicaudal-D-related protein 2-like [Esox lucius]|uniref:bicaudal-D-related protein 2-like n=1 Tax=Esox lucius TaxID=8010 RepID=UPI000577DD9A|nr:bicaudal-D-related protein 2-like [Esox lucius]
MGEPVPFSILNERLRPRFTAMERLCYSLDPLDEGIKRPGAVRGTLTTHSPILRDKPQTRDDSCSTATEPEDESEQEDVIKEGLSHVIEEGDDGLEPLTLAIGDRLMPSLTVEGASPDGDELTAVSESVSVENDGPSGLSTVCEGDGSEATGKDNNPPRWNHVEGTLPDIIRSGRQLNRRRTLGPVSDTLNEVRREVELSRRRSLRLKAQVDKLQGNRNGSGWSQEKEKVTQEIQSVLKLLLPLAQDDSSLVQPSGQEVSLDTSLVLLLNIARKLALNHMAQDSKSGVGIESDVVDSAVLQQALWDRDDALEKKKAMEAELLRSKTDMMLLNNQLLEAVQKRLELAVELETWKDDVQLILQHQLQSQQQQAAEEAQRKPSRLGLLRRTNRPPIQKPAPSPGPDPLTYMPGKVLHTPVSSPVPSPQRTPVTWKDRLKRGKGSKAGPRTDQNAAQTSLSLSGSRQEDGFQNIDL